MLTHALPYSSRDLVLQCTEPSPTKGWFGVLVSHVTPRFSALLGNPLIWALDTLAKHSATCAMTLEGITERVLSQPHSEAIDPDDEVYTRLLALETSLKKTHVRLVGVWQEQPPIGPAKLRLAALRVVQANLAAANAARDLRGAIMAHDANLDAMAHARLAQQPPTMASISTQELAAALDAAFTPRK